MNNDIPRDLNSSINTQKISTTTAVNNTPVQKMSKISSDEKSVNGSMAFLGTMGCAQVQMNNPCKKYVDAFLKDPDYAQAYVEFCDSLTDKGYPLEEAVVKTDRVFSALNNIDIYK